MVTWVRSAGSPPFAAALRLLEPRRHLHRAGNGGHGGGSGWQWSCASPSKYSSTGAVHNITKKGKKMGGGESVVLGADLQLARVGSPWAASCRLKRQHAD
jgi:hypothetical protein